MILYININDTDIDNIINKAGICVTQVLIVLALLCERDSKLYTNIQVTGWVHYFYILMS